MSGFTTLDTSCWRAVSVHAHAEVLEGTVRAGRYNRPGQRTLYMSGSPHGVAAAMKRYGTAERLLMRLRVTAERLIDLREVGLCRRLGIDRVLAKGDWMASLNKGDEPSSWCVADQVRDLDADGLIDASRQDPGEWHLVLFRWNTPGAATVTIDHRTR